MSNPTASADGGAMPEASRLNYFQHRGAPAVSPRERLAERTGEIVADHILDNFTKILNAYQKAKSSPPEPSLEPKVVLQ
jgi:hypothetical protein